MHSFKFRTGNGNNLFEHLFELLFFECSLDYQVRFQSGVGVNSKKCVIFRTLTAKNRFFTGSALRKIVLWVETNSIPENKISNEKMEN